MSIRIMFLITHGFSKFGNLFDFKLQMFTYNVCAVYGLALPHSVSPI